MVDISTDENIKSDPNNFLAEFADTRKKQDNETFSTIWLIVVLVVAAIIVYNYFKK